MKIQRCFIVAFRLWLGTVSAKVDSILLIMSCRRCLEVDDL